MPQVYVLGDLSTLAMALVGIILLLNTLVSLMNRPNPRRIAERIIYILEERGQRTRDAKAMEMAKLNSNPFCAGPGWNLTEQGRLLVQDYDLAVKMAADAGVSLEDRAAYHRIKTNPNTEPAVSQPDDPAALDNAPPGYYVGKRTAKRRPKSKVKRK